MEKSAAEKLADRQKIESLLNRTANANASRPTTRATSMEGWREREGDKDDVVSLDEMSDPRGVRVWRNGASSMKITTPSWSKGAIAKVNHNHGRARVPIAAAPFPAVAPADATAIDGPMGKAAST